MLEWADVKPVAKVIDAKAQFIRRKRAYTKMMFDQNRVPKKSGGADPISLEDGRRMVEVARAVAKANARKAKREARERAKAQAERPFDQPPRRG